MMMATSCGGFRGAPLHPEVIIDLCTSQQVKEYQLTANAQRVAYRLWLAAPRQGASATGEASCLLQLLIQLHWQSLDTVGSFLMLKGAWCMQMTADDEVP